MTTYEEGFLKLWSNAGLPDETIDWLLNNFKELSKSWGHRTVNHGPGFPCGITHGGHPFECSVSVLKKGRSAFRFIAQPYEAPKSNAAVALGFARGNLNVMSHRDAVIEFLEFFFQDARPDFAGNFTCWLGVSSDGLGCTARKIYLNPYAARSEPGYLLVRFFQSISVDPKSIQTVFDVFNRLPTRSFLSMLGVNLPLASQRDAASSSPEGKIYFIIPHASASATLALLREFTEENEDEMLQLISPSPETSGEIHLSLSFSSESQARSRIKMNYYVRDFFPVQEDVLSALRHCTSWSEESTTLLQNLISCPPRLTFLGVGAGKCDLYFCLK
jgi:hypothetical protein